jgi:hypothetical protein
MKMITTKNDNIKNSKNNIKQIHEHKAKYLYSENAQL